MRTTTVAALCALLLTGALQVRAQDFVVRQRTIRVSPEALERMLGNEMYGETALTVAHGIFGEPVDAFLDDDSGDVEVQEATMYVKGGMVRMESEGGFVVLDVDSGTMRMFNPAARTYFEWTRQDQEAMMSGMEDLMAEMEEAYGEEEEYYEEDEDAYYDDEEGAGEEGVTEAIGSGVEATINGWSATSLEVADDESVEVSWCSSDRSELAALMRHVADQFAALDEGEDEDEEEVDPGCEDGLPVRIQSFSLLDYTYGVEDVLEVDERDLPASLFEIPSGYRKVKSPFGE